jgi:hypothetical protein
MSRREILLRANPEYLPDIEESFRLAQQEKAGGVSQYWEHHRALAGFEVVDASEGLVRIRGESGFYFPGRSYSTLEWVNTLDRLLWLTLQTGDLLSKPFARKALDFSIPTGRKGSTRFGYPFPGRRTAYDYLRAQYHLASLAPHLPVEIREGRERLTAVEIGPGTGLLALAVKQLIPNSTLVLMDLPEILPFSSLFLTTVMPEKKYLFLNHYEAQRSRWKEYDFVFLPPAAAAQLPSHSFQLALNTDSMQEMNLSMIHDYFQLIRRLLQPPALFYSSNRREKWIGNENTRLADYPYTADDRDLFSRENAFMRHRWIWKKFHYRIPYPWREPRRNGEVVIQKLTVLRTNTVD